MKNGDVMVFLRDLDMEEWSVLYQGRCYFIECFSDAKKKKYYFEIQSWKAHTDDHVSITTERDEKGLPVDPKAITLGEFDTFEEARKDFLSQKLWDNHTKTFWEVQEEMEWLDF